jgi:hypothetical protein
VYSDTLRAISFVCLRQFKRACAKQLVQRDTLISNLLGAYVNPFVSLLQLAVPLQTHKPATFAFCGRFAKTPRSGPKVVERWYMPQCFSFRPKPISCSFGMYPRKATKSTAEDEQTAYHGRKMAELNKKNCDIDRHKTR